jgi:hypothetical protein
VAGRKGGEAVSRDRAHMSAIGREGGHSRGRARQSQNQPAGANGGNTAVSQTDTERSNFIGHATDRGNGAGNSGNSRPAGTGNEQTARNESASGNRNF